MRYDISANDFYRGIIDSLSLYENDILKKIKNLEQKAINRGNEGIRIQNYRRELELTKEFKNLINVLHLNVRKRENVNDYYYKHALTSISSFLTDKEREDLQKIVNYCLKNCNKDTEKLLHEKTQEAQKALNKTHFRRHNIVLYYKKYKIGSALEKAESIRRHEIMHRGISLAKTDPEYKGLSNAEIMPFRTLMNANIEELGNDKSLLTVKDNYHAIKNAMVKRKSYQLCIENINSISFELSDLIKDDAKPIVDFLETIKQRLSQSIDEINKYLSNYDLEKVDQFAMAKCEEKRRDENLIVSKQKYYDMVYKLFQEYYKWGNYNIHPTNFNELEKYANDNFLTEKERDEMIEKAKKSMEEYVKTHEVNKKSSQERRDEKRKVLEDSLNQLNEIQMMDQSNDLGQQALDMVNQIAVDMNVLDIL